MMRQGAMERKPRKTSSTTSGSTAAGRRPILGNLTIGQQQLVATAKRRDARHPLPHLRRADGLPDASGIRPALPPHPPAAGGSGVTIVYISHRMEEVFELADRVSVLRDGTHVGTRLISETNDNRADRADDQPLDRADLPQGKTADRRQAILETKGLSGPGFSDVSLTVRSGEIVGLYGLIGAGRSEFALGLYGRHKPTAGEVYWDGKKVVIDTERKAMDLGIALAPESRRDQGLCLNLPIGLNINLPVFGRLSRGFTISPKLEAGNADKQINDLKIKTPTHAVLASAMSGGNQQKIVIGKWLSHGARLFIFDEPTVGVDVGTKAEIYRLFAELLKQGAGIILISSYLPEVYELADRLHVFRQGRLVASHDYRTASHEDVLTEAIGV
jgi:ribose transport system ATP-binding protein